MRRTPSSNHGSPVGAGHLPLPQNGAGGGGGGFPNHLSPPQHQGSPHSSPQNVNGLPLPPGQQPHQRLPNGGLAAPGLQQNGINRSSPLSQTPFSNPQAIQLAIQQQQSQLAAQQQAAAMQAAGMPGRPLSQNSQLPPSRPASSASSSHHQQSPAMAALSLPPQTSPHLAMRVPPGTPPQGQAGLVNPNKRGSPMNQYQMQPQGVPGMKTNYGNFVQN
jgi:enhancer of polycomb-like protein